MEPNVFDANRGAFTLTSMTAAINRAPFVPGRLGQLGIFRARGIATTHAWIEVKRQKLYLVNAVERGAPAQKNQAELRDAIPVKCQHLPVEDRLNADELQGVRQFGTGSQLQGVQEAVNEKLGTMARSLDATVEYHRMGAITGKVLDADGTTVLLDIFKTFGVTQPTAINFDLGAADPVEGAVHQKCTDVIRTIEDELGNVPIEYVHAPCSPEFFDALVIEPEVREAYRRYRDSEFLRGRTARRSFWYGGILFEEYRGKVGSKRFIPANEVRFVPVGVPDLFDEIYAPANYMSAVNTIGLPRYAKPTMDPKDRWVDIDAQANPLVICNTPRVLQRGVKSSG